MPIYLKRAIEGQIKKDVAKKMVFLAGPRQTGKTSLSLHIFDIALVLDTDPDADKHAGQSPGRRRRQ